MAEVINDPNSIGTPKAQDDLLVPEDFQIKGVPCPMSKHNNTVRHILEGGLDEDTLREYIKIFKQTCNSYMSFIAYVALSKVVKLSEIDWNCLRTYAQSIMHPLRSTSEATKSFYKKPRKDSKHIDFMNKIREEWNKSARSVLDLVVQATDNMMEKNTENEKRMTLFSLRMKADYARYYHEIVNTEESKKLAMEHNENAWQTIVELKLPYNDPHRAGTALNYSVHLHDVLNDPQGAIDFTTNFLDNIKEEKTNDPNKEEEDEDSRNTGYMGIVNLMYQNCQLWKEEQSQTNNLERINNEEVQDESPAV